MLRLRQAVLVMLLCLASGCGPASAQGAIIIKLLQGVVAGAGEEAGKEIYNYMRGKPGPAAPANGAIPPVVVLPKPPSPDGLVWRIKNNHATSIAVQFHSDTREGVQWPEKQQAYLIAAGASAAIPLKCQPQEKICFGGWSHDGRPASAGVVRTWGKGRHPERACANCCRRCGAPDPEVALSP